MPDAPEPPNYNRIAGSSLERLAALSDGVFAVAMTLLVLDLRVPAAAAMHDEAGLWHALLPLAPRLLVYLMSVMTLGIFWVGQQTQLNHLRRGDRDLAWLHIAFLFAVSLVPFSTALIAEFVTFRVALRGVLGEHPGAGRDAVRELAARPRARPDARRDDRRAGLRGGAADHLCAGAVRGRRAAVRGEHVLEPRPR